jgi:hypothetical protein
MEHYISLQSFFTQELEPLNYDHIIKAYLVSIFSQYKTSEYDLSNVSITLEYADAKSQQNFEKFQKVGDWLVFSSVLYPAHLTDASPEYYQQIARMSYWKCYRLVRWHLYEQLADQFIPITEATRQLLIREGRDAFSRALP